MPLDPDTAGGGMGGAATHGARGVEAVPLSPLPPSWERGTASVVGAADGARRSDTGARLFTDASSPAASLFSGAAAVSGRWHQLHWSVVALSIPHHLHNIRCSSATRGPSRCIKIEGHKPGKEAGTGRK